MPRDSSMKPGGLWFEYFYDNPHSSQSPKVDFPLHQRLWELFDTYHVQKQLLHCSLSHSEAEDILDDLHWNDLYSEDDDYDEADDEHATLSSIVNEAQTRANCIYDEPLKYGIVDSTSVEINETIAAVLSYNTGYWQARREFEEILFIEAQDIVSNAPHYTLPTVNFVALTVFWFILGLFKVLDGKIPSISTIILFSVFSLILLTRFIQYRRYLKHLVLLDLSLRRKARATDYVTVFQLAEQYHRNNSFSYESNIQEIEM